MTNNEIKSEARRIVFEYLNVLIDYRHSDAKKAIKCAIKHYEEMKIKTNDLLIDAIADSGIGGLAIKTEKDEQDKILDALKLMLAEFNNGLK